MIARIEPLSAAIRVWIESDGDYGVPFFWSATVRWVDRYSMEIMGVSEETSTTNKSRITPSLFRAIAAEAKRWDAKRVGYRRIKDGNETVKWFKL
jgi:hypothetical protein